MELRAVQTRIFAHEKGHHQNKDNGNDNLTTHTNFTSVTSKDESARARISETVKRSGSLSPATVLEVLKSSPGEEELRAVLRWLVRGCSTNSSSASSASLDRRKNTGVVAGVGDEISTTDRETEVDDATIINTRDKGNNVGDNIAEISVNTDDDNDENDKAHIHPAADTTSNSMNVTAFNIHHPSPQSASIIHVLIHDIIPTFWPITTSTTAATAMYRDDNPQSDENQNGKVRRLLVRVLCSVSGLGALVARLRVLLGDGGNGRLSSSGRELNGNGNAVGRRKEDGAGRVFLEMAVLMEVLRDVLKGDGFVGGIWKSGVSIGQGGQGERDGGAKAMMKKSLLWKEGLGLLAGGKVLSVAGEVERMLNENSEGIRDVDWVADGESYVRWLGGNVWRMTDRDGEEEDEHEDRRRAAGQVLAKGLKLGFVDAMVRAVFADAIAGNERAIRESVSLLDCLATYEQKTVLYSLVRTLEKRYLCSNGGRADERNIDALGSVASLLATFITNSSVREETMIEWLAGLSAEATRQSHLAHRAVLLSLSTDLASVKAALSTALELFADKLFIRHTPIFQQEINAQILLLLIGSVHRVEQAHLKNTSKSSIYLNAISNHLASTSPRSRFLGMVVGTAVSDLVDTKDKRMNFSSEEMEGPDGRWYRDLTIIKDVTKPIRALASTLDSDLQPPKKKKSFVAHSALVKRPKPSDATKASSKVISIEEITDETSGDDDLPSYAKPHSDPEDSDEDPELVQRNKPKAPVYIRDLLVGLRDIDDYDKHRLALLTAPSLIRRKAAFGTEVIDNIEDLATILVGLNDKYEMESFQRHRIQGMIALLIADPARMGPWYARSFYNGEYSMSQRASVLTTLGLGAREIAGLGKEDEAVTGSNSSSEPQFPSKRLPENLHNHYASILPSPTLNSPRSAALPSSTPIDTLSSNLSKTMLQPLAARAADEVTGPTALKVRTFSSRLAVQSRTAPPTSNHLAKILATAFFFPLVGRWSIQLKDSAPTTTTSPFLLSHLLRTLALILHAGGSTSPDLREVTAEFWALLLSVRSGVTKGAADELPVLEALLFALLTLLDVNLSSGNGEEGGRRIAEEHARELLETQSWVEGLFERIGQGRSDEDEKVRSLAAGVLVRCREVVERYQRLLMGDLVDYM